MVNLNFSLTGSNGDTIVFDNENYVLNPEVLGFGIPATKVRIDESAGTGGVWRNTKRGVREVDLPVTVLGNSRDDVLVKLRRLVRLLNDANGPTKINAIHDHPGGENLYLEAHYTGGDESEWGSSAGNTWNRWVLSFQAPMPHWVSSTIERFTIGSGSTGRGLLPQLSKMKISSSETLGTISAINVGDVAAYPVWTIRGPVTNLLISNGSQNFSFNRIITGSETVIVDTERGTVEDEFGTNLYSILNPAPKLFVLQPGVNGLTVYGADSTPNTRITCEYSPRFEVVH
jgi:hypothetical protein